MPSASTRRRAAVVGFWCLIGLLFSVQNYLIETHVEAMDVTFADAVVNMTPNTLAWAVLAPGVLGLARRLRDGGASWKASLPLQVVVGCLVGLLHSVLAVSLFVLILRALGHHLGWSKTLSRHLILFFGWNLVVYAAIAATGSALAYYRESRERERRAIRLEARLAESRLQALRAQLHPHFLFNALNGIAELIHEDPDAAERMVLGLAGLLRALLKGAGSQEIPLLQELDFIRSYLAIEEMRFQDRLAVDWRVDPRALSAPVPSLVLQPLVENALRHGAASRAGACRLVIEARPDGASLRLRVSDDGRGFARDAQGRVAEGLGLANTRGRLAQLYGAEGRLDLADNEGGGARVTVTIPLRPGTGGGGAS
jgi:two-component system, LytTR family, sensor kinase